MADLTLLDKLRQVAAMKTGWPAPEFLATPNAWVEPLAALAAEAVEALEHRKPSYEEVMAGLPGEIEKRKAWKARPLTERLELFARECLDSNLDGSAEDLREAVQALQAAETAMLYRQWQPIETAPVTPWSPELASYYRFECLLQYARGSVSEGWAYYVPPPRSRPTKLPVLRWANRIGQCFPKYWMPMPAPCSEHAGSMPMEGTTK